MALVDLHLLDGEAQPDVDPDRVIAWPARILLLLLLALAAIFGLRLFLLPVPLGAIAPADEFSASRAAQNVAAISAQAPGGVEAALAASLAALGLAAEPLPAGSRGVAARLRGTQPAGTILLVTPYDPAGSAPGLAGSSAMLEALRALSTGPKPTNDILVLFSATRPLDEAVLAAYDTALVFRFERITDRGPVALVGATGRSGGLVREALRDLPHPTVTFAPLDLGTRPASRAATLSFAAIGGPSMEVGADLRTMQDAGATALALLRRFSSASLPVPEAPDVVAMTIGQDQVVTYPATWSGRMAVAALAAAFVLIGIGLLTRKLDARPVATGLVLFPLIAVVTWALGLVVLSLLFRWNPGGHLLPWGTPHSGWFMGAVVALSVGFVSLLVTVLRSFRKTPNADFALAAAGLFWWAFFGFVARSLYPDLAPLAALPVLLLIPAFLVLYLTKDVSRHPWLGATALAVAAVPAVLLLAPVCRFLDVAAGWAVPAPRLSVAAVSAALSALVTMLLIPHLSLPRRRWLFPAFCAVAAVGLFGAGVWLSP
ncbi:MAG: hypothetical protein ACHQPI_08785 [Thermoanaerobaculia bacterium]